ncbi:Immunoglobulin domain containing protein 9 [Sarcoptes scabiei]|uniref:Immunoglobulin domain containing protein 9 n=1 Tax=Sarcoptes scabiei TaxID=52283 RepID=A0A132AB78_SARSC|nr:Immunoglobulin domain containing protein 9 [Sarcoptes scabiei]
MVSSTSKTSPYLLKFLDFKWLIAFFRLHQNEESPKILPFYKEIRQPEGSSFSLTCNAIRGSSPSSDSLKFIWHRNSNEIIESSRHNIETKGSLSYFTLSRLTSDDWGNYSCIVFNRNGFDSQWTILRVDESPELSKFHPFLSQSIGSSFTLFCSSMKGSKPLEFVWNKNGLNIKNSIIFDRYQIDSKPSYSLLSIHSLQPNDSGNYSCSVTNPFGYDLQWSLLEIKGYLSHKISSILLRINF